jgi:hypothetical protein
MALESKIRRCLPNDRAVTPGHRHLVGNAALAGRFGNRFGIVQHRNGMLPSSGTLPLRRITAQGTILHPGRDRAHEAASIPQPATPTSAIDHPSAGCAGRRSVDKKLIEQTEPAARRGGCGIERRSGAAGFVVQASARVSFMWDRSYNAYAIIMVPVALLPRATRQ